MVRVSWVTRIRVTRIGKSVRVRVINVDSVFGLGEPRVFTVARSRLSSAVNGDSAHRAYGTLYLKRPPETETSYQFWRDII